MSYRTKLNLGFYYRADKAGKRTGTNQVQARVSVSGKKAYITLNSAITPDHWDESRKTVKTSCPQYETIKSEMDTFVKDMEAIFTLCSKKEDRIFPEQLKEEYLRVIKGRIPTTEVTVYTATLLTTIDQLIVDFTKKVYLPEDHKEKRSKETLKQWNSTRTKLIEYLGYLKTGIKPFISRQDRRNKDQQAQYIIDGKQYDLLLSEITPSFAEEFLNYLSEDRTIILGGAAANKQIKNTKQVFTYAIGKGWLKINPLAYFRTADAETEVIPLEDDEINRLKNARGLVIRLERVRDCYIVQIYTGFSFQDIEALTKENIYKEPATGVFFLLRERGKTGIDEMVPILPIVMAIMEKYKDDPECIAKGVLFPVPSNSCYNAYLKELQIIARVAKKLHTHLGRHTFAHIMLNHYGFSIEIVSRMLGHKNIRTTQRYCKISIRRIAEAFAPELVVERPKLKVIRNINKTYIHYGINAEQKINKKAA